MKIDAVLKAYGDAEKIAACFEPEMANKKRSHFTIIKEKDYVVFQIEADDSVALRATLNGITKLLTVYEKVGEDGRKN